MNTLAHFFDWLVAASLRASLLTPVVLLLQAALRRYVSARMRYALWLPVLIVLLMPVLPQSQWSIEHVFLAAPRPAPEQITHAVIAPAVGAPPVAHAAAVPRSTPIHWQSIFLLTWAGLSASMLILGAVSFTLTLHRFKKFRLPVSGELLATLAQVAREIRLRRVPRVLISSCVSSPAVTGLLRPTLLLPAQFDREFTPAEVRLVLRHELMHLRRGDLSLNALMCLLMALHWFNPLLWLAFLKARADREAACDAQVLQDAPADRRAAYGHALLKVETAFCPRGFSLGFVGIFQRGSALRSRIRSIATHRAPHPAMRPLIALCIILMTFLGITRAATPDLSDTPLISIQARFVELTVSADSRITADTVRIEKAPGTTESPTSDPGMLKEMLEGIPVIPNKDGPVKVILTDPQYQIVIRKLLQRKGVDLLSTPTVTVHSGQKAAVEIAREFGPPSDQKSPTQKVGVMLDVLPTLTEKDTLDLALAPRVVEFEGFVKAKDGTQTPTYSERKADTHATLKLGQTALLDLGAKTDTQAVEDHIDGKIIRSTLYLTRRVFVMVTAQPVHAAAKSSAAPVFNTVKSVFRPGDWLQVSQIKRSEDSLTLTVDYSLFSAEKAKVVLAMNASSENEGQSRPDLTGAQTITKGSGSIVLRHAAASSGTFRISFRDPQTGEAFGSISCDPEKAAATDAGAPSKAPPATDTQVIIKDQAASSPAAAQAEKLRKAKAQDYSFSKAVLGDVLRFLATDAGMSFISLPHDSPICQKLTTFHIRSSPFSVLETLCRANGLVLVCDQNLWHIREADDVAEVTKNYALPKTRASVETILQDITMVIRGHEPKPAEDAPPPSVTFDKEQNTFIVKAPRLQHSWVSAYFQGLSSSAKSGGTK